MYLYRHFDKDGSLLYVGQSIKPLDRLRQHKECSHWFDDIVTVKIERFSTRSDAIQAERKAIYEEKPLHNIRRPTHQPEQYEALEEVNDADWSRFELVRKIAFRPTYTLQQLANVLQTSAPEIIRLWNENKLGYVVVGTRSTRWGEKPKQRTTGWQLISYLENLTNEQDDHR